MMIEYRIEKPKHLNNPKDAFGIKCLAMFGDGDEYRNVTLTPIQRTPGYEAQLEEVINLLDSMKLRLCADEHDYNNLPHFAKWFLGEDNGMYGENPFLDGVFIGMLFSYKITYYDSEGIEHGVSFRIKN